MLKKVLIANRGEIACRIMSTCERLGIAAATIHSDADVDAPHVRRVGESVRVGAAPPAQSYLNIAAIIEAARAVGADAVHPGIGFLSENADFAEAAEAAGLAFIGPRPHTLRRFADKASAKREAALAGVPVIAGSSDSWADAADVARQVRASELPVLLKAVAGGGGRGVRVVRSLDRLEETIESAMHEAQAAFGLPDLLVERFIDRPRHIEVQIAGDGRGRVIHLLERECTLQRRFQKVIEEAPAASLTASARRSILEAAVRLGERVSYRGLGTVEFLVSGDSFWFLECNPRLQVEHTVTEEICGIDLVELQLAIAGGAPLPLAQDDVRSSGAAVQARIYAEDPEQNFMPSTGVIRGLELPGDGYRVDAGVDTGSEVTPYYDAMVAKLVARAGDRAQAIRTLKAGLDRSVILGVRTNLSFLSNLLADPRVVANEIDNRFIDRELDRLAAPSEPTDAMVAHAAAVWLQAVHPARADDPWSAHSAWRLDDGQRSAPAVPNLLIRHTSREWHVSFFPAATDSVGVAVGARRFELRLRAGPGSQFQVSSGDAFGRFHAVAEEEAVHLQSGLHCFRLDVRPFLQDHSDHDEYTGSLLSPLMGRIIKVNVKEGDAVAEATPLLTLESMKMETEIVSPRDGVVVVLNCAEGEHVERDALLVVVE
jgi:3-methylcrotonyl-CoA carboxylase alpha subunit